jgi:uncharacterized protein with NRDE domain
MSQKLDTLISWSNKDHQNKLYNFLKNLQDKDYWFSIKLYRKSRSKEANGYYWSCVIREVCDFHGYDPNVKENRDKIHEDLKKEFNSKEITFIRKSFACTLDESILEYNQIVDYMERIDWKPEVYDGNVLIPLRVVRDIEERNDFGEEIEITVTESRPVTTTASDTVEFFEYIERIRDHYAQHHNFYIAEPSRFEDRNSDEFDEMLNNL